MVKCSKRDMAEFLAPKDVGWTPRTHITSLPFALDTPEVGSARGVVGRVSKRGEGNSTRQEIKGIDGGDWKI